MKVFLTLIGILVCLGLKAQSEILEPLSVDDKWETWYRNIPVSGEVRVGIVSVQPKHKVHESFFVNIPETESDEICVSVNSNDGRYSGSRSYDITKVKKGVSQLKWESEYHDNLRKYDPTDLTIMVSLGECETESNNFLLASWEDLQDEDDITIYLNSERRSRIMVRNTLTRETEEFTCSELKDRPNVAYNCNCVVPQSAICADCEVFVEQRVRRGRSFSFVRYPLNIKL